MAPPIINAPMKRKGVRKRQSTMSPLVHRRSGPGPKAATRPSAPGKLVTQRSTRIIHSMPSPMSRQHQPSRPSGMLINPRIPTGMTHADTMGIASRFATTP